MKILTGFIYKSLLFIIVNISYAKSQTNTTVGNIDIHATFHNIGVQVNIIGDTNRNASATMEANINGTGFVAVHDLSRVFIDTNTYGTYPQRFVGSVFSLAPDTQVDVRITVVDPDGVVNAVSTVSISTKSMQVPQSIANTIHVATNGDDISGNGSSTSPFASIQKAIFQAEIGDTVIIHSGVYHEGVEIFFDSSNATQAFTSIKSAGDGEVILDGSDVSLNNPNVWASEGNNTFSASLNSPNNESYYVGFDGNRLFKYFSLSDLQNLVHNTNGGFFTDSVNQKIYVNFPNNSLPNGHQITVSNLEYGIKTNEVHNIVIDGLIFKNFNASKDSAAIQVTNNSFDVWIINSKFEHMEMAILLEEKVENIIVMNNEFSDQGVLALDWNTVKDNQNWLERGGLFCSNDEYSGKGIIFINNYIHEMFDGVKIAGNEILIHALNSDIEYNLFENLADDGIETDGYSSNVRIQYNRFESLLIGVSVAPALAGPTYITRNLMVDLKNLANTDWKTGAVKFSIGDEIYGDIFIYHNTGTTTEAQREAFSVTNEADWSHLVLKNNIWSGIAYGFFYYLDNAASLNFAQDYDLLYATSGLVAQYQGDDYADISDYYTASGVCQNCLEGNPLFINQLTGNYHLNDSSPAINSGIIIPGINTLDSNGDAPDIGRYEFQVDLIFANSFD